MEHERIYEDRKAEEEFIGMVWYSHMGRRVESAYTEASLRLFFCRGLQASSGSVSEITAVGLVQSFGGDNDLSQRLQQPCLSKPNLSLDS